MSIQRNVHTGVDYLQRLRVWNLWNTTEPLLTCFVPQSDPYLQVTDVVRERKRTECAISDKLFSWWADELDYCDKDDDLRAGEDKVKE